MIFFIGIVNFYLYITLKLGYCQCSIQLNVCNFIAADRQMLIGMCICKHELRHRDIDIVSSDVTEQNSKCTK